jgi:general secretion pathway protein D
MKLNTAILALAAIVPMAAFAQFEFGGGGGGSAPKQAWESFKLPKATMKLDFRNANIDLVLSLYTKTSGITIVKDPSLTTPITLTTAKAVPLGEAFEVLNAALSLRNYEMRKEGKILVIRQKQQRGGGGSGSFDPSMFSQFTSGGNVDLKVYPIKFANASQVARVINDVFAQQTNPFAAFAGGAFQIGGGGNGRRGGGGGNRFGGGTTGAQVRASSDDYSNTVIVNAPSKMQSQIEDLIGEIDKQTEDPLKSKVYKLEFADADDLQPVVQSVLQANTPRGRGGASTNTPIDRQFSFFPGFGGGGQNRNNSASGTVLAESRTNTLVVTTTEQNQVLVDQVVKELDQKVNVQASTFIFPLSNARADQVAQLFRQAFGTRQGTNGGNLNAGTGNNNRAGGNNNQNPFRQNNNGNRNGAGGGGNGGGGANLLTPDDNLILALADPNASSGLLETEVSVDGGTYAQFFGGGQFQGGGGGGQQRRQTNQGPTGRDSQGRLIQTQDLTGQITVIPDQNTNSIIVVGSPENAELIKSLLGQLDKIPEQVMIETIIVEASLDASTKLGVEWNFTQEKAFGSTGVTGNATQDFQLKANNTNPQGFRYTISGGNLSALVNALQSDTKFNVLSTPRIFTSNNVQAEINISQRVPFVVSQRVDANGNITYNYDFEDVGIVLTVTPRITANGYVTMDVSQTANDLQGFTSFNAPIVNQRQAQTSVAVRDGETIILGGIIRNTVSTTVKKIPLLGDIPVLGNLFKSTDKTNSKTELLVFLTPRVVRNPEEAAKLTEEQKKQLSKPTQSQLDRAGFNDHSRIETSPPKKGG